LIGCDFYFGRAIDIGYFEQISFYSLFNTSLTHIYE